MLKDSTSTGMNVISMSVPLCYMSFTTYSKASEDMRQRYIAAQRKSKENGTLRMLPDCVPGPDPEVRFTTAICSRHAVLIAAYCHI